MPEAGGHPQAGGEPDIEMSGAALTRTMIEAAAKRIAPHIRRTPVMHLARGALGGDFIPVFKLEFLQHAGSFKTRGAFNTMLSMPVPMAGVAAASGGNHGVAVALAARALGHEARIFVPEISSPAKIEAIRRHGAELVIGGARYDDAQKTCDDHVARTGALKIHPFAALPTLEGQGTTALEWAQEAELDAVLVAAGGGGLVSGMAAFFAGSRTRVIAVEPEGSRALQAALEAGGPVDVPVESIAADSLGARNVGELVHSIASRTIAQALLVPDRAIRAAQEMLWRDFRMALEPGGATALAAVLEGAYRPEPGERVGILLCGANLDPASLA
jgi:threonine dehydratase